MAPYIELRVKDQVGALVGVFNDFRALAHKKRVNGIGNLTLEMTDINDIGSLFEKDGQIEVWRSDQPNGINPYLDWEGFVRKWQYITTEEGDSIVTFTAIGYQQLLARRIIMYPSESAEASKVGSAEDVMKEFVTENLGPTLQVGRFGSAIALPGFTVEASQARGGSWNGARAYDSVFSVVSGIAEESGLFFDIVSTGDIQWQFRVYEGQRGTDRSRAGIDMATGLNAVGNAPVVFSLPKGNISDILLDIDSSQEQNAILALGQGLEDDRVVVESVDADAIGESPWNRHEGSINANRETTLAALQSVANREIEARKQTVTFSFTPLQIPGLLLGRDYFWGDKITALYRNTEYDIQIIEQSATYQGAESEQIDLILGTVV